MTICREIVLDIKTIAGRHTSKKRGGGLQTAQILASINRMVMWAKLTGKAADQLQLECSTGLGKQIPA